MKRKLGTVIAFVLIAIMAMPVGVFARAMDDVTRRVEGGQVFVPLREAAEAHGWTVDWVSNTQEVLLINPVSGYVNRFHIDLLVLLLGGFVENGVTWIPYEIAVELFETISFILHLSEEGQAIALSDFDFLVDFILENTPWDGLIDRLFIAGGFEGIMGTTSEWLEDMRPMQFTIADQELFDAQIPSHPGDTPREEAANYLFMLLVAGLSPMLGGIGHLGPRTLDLYTAQTVSFSRQRDSMYYWGYDTTFLDIFLEAFLHPSAIWFYGEVDMEADERDLIPAVPGNVQTYIFDDIAILRIDSFLVDESYDEAIIVPFLYEIQDFAHLIIDIRGNFGGFMSYPIVQIFSRLINEPTVVSSHEFFVGSDLGLRVMQGMANLDTWDENRSYVRPAAPFIEARGMIYFNEYDKARLDYVRVTYSVFHPCEYAFGFEGKIWLLVDQNSASASNMLVEMMQYTGLATVVGTNTSRVMSATHVYIALPYTGIVFRADLGYRTDGLGRSLEFYGITPDITIPLWADALDYVLALIDGEPLAGLPHPKDTGIPF